MMTNNNNYNTFGEFLVDKRRIREIPSAVMADALGISPSYYSDIEKNRRNPPPGKETLAMIVNMLCLHGDDIAIFYDLAGKARSEAPPDLPDYINKYQVVRVALRLAKDLGSEDDWHRFINDLESRRSERGTVKCLG